MKTRSRDRKTAGRRKAASAVDASPAATSLPPRGPDELVVLAGPGRGGIRERASRFFAFAHPVTTAEEVAKVVHGLEREYHDATHVAYAWRTGSGPSLSERSSDAGEPSGTAGQPIAAAIASAGVTDTVVAVVRYFGGTKLGTGGLVRAYREAADRALAAAGRKTIRRTVRVTVTCSFDRLGAVRRLARPPDVTFVAESFDPDPVLQIDVSASRLPEILASLSEARVRYEVGEEQTR
jgi:uncharacterized YigZ family protein